MSFRVMLWILPAVFLVVSPLLAGADEVAISRAEAIWNMDSNIGLTRSELIQVCRRIEHLKARKGKKAQQRRRTKFSCVIEKLKGGRAYLIRDLPGKTRIGYGYHKQVVKAIFYGRRPKIVAHCLCDASGKAEIKILRKLRGQRGIVPFLGSRSKGKKKHSIFLEYYPAGTLGHLLKQQHPFSEAQALQIVEDLICGLQAMHDRGFVHRDLHAGNILLREYGNGEFEAALADFGKTLSVSKTRSSDVPQVPKTRNPPEALLRSYAKINRYLVDSYALGCNFYHLLWGEIPPWASMFDIRAMSTYQYSQRKAFFEAIVRMYHEAEEHRIGHLLRKEGAGENLSAYERLQIAVFRMVHYDVSRRLPLKRVLSYVHTGEKHGTQYRRTKSGRYRLWPSGIYGGNLRSTGHAAAPSF